jgi:signal transduction histidine kinase
MTLRKPKPKPVRAAPSPKQARAKMGSTPKPSASGKAKRSPRRKDAPRAELARLRAELTTLERGRAELCSVLSHDLRNPLTVVVWSAQLLARRLPTDDAAGRHLQSITRAAEEMNQILHELGDAARIPDGRLAQAIELVEGEIRPLAEQAVAANQGQINSKQITLAFEVPADLGTIACDKDRMGRVLTALLSGALRRSPKGGRVSLSASRRVSGHGEELRIDVEDAGPEIPPDDQEALFTLPTAPRPGSPRRPRPTGSAIALFVARGVIEAHGGRLWVESEPGQGARFVLTLPVAATAVTAPGSPDPPVPMGGSPNPPVPMGDSPNPPVSASRSRSGAGGRGRSRG